MIAICKSGAVPSWASSAGVHKGPGAGHVSASILRRAIARSFSERVMVDGRGPPGGKDALVALFEDPPDKGFAFEARGANVLTFAPPGEPDDDLRVFFIVVRHNELSGTGCPAPRVGVGVRVG